MKKLIALLLVAVMCLSFVACNNESGTAETPSSGENTENNGGSTSDNTTNKNDSTNDGIIDEEDSSNDTTSGDETTNNGGSTNNGENNGSNLEKIERGTVTTSDNTLLPILFQALSEKGYNYTFNEDGTCSDTEYWWIEEDNEKSMLIFIATEYKWKYKILIEHKVNENNVDLAWISIDIADYVGDSFLGFWTSKQPFAVQIESSEDTNLQKRYEAIIENFNKYVEYGSFNSSTQFLEENAATTYLYNEFKALGNYKDCEAYLEKFIVIPDALSKITYIKTDNFGQTKEYTSATYYYTKFGECPALTNIFDFLNIGYSGRPSYEEDYNYLYDENERLSGIQVYCYGNIVIQVEFEYDNNKNIVKAHFITSEENYTNIYTYNENNRLLTADVVYHAVSAGGGDLFGGYFARYEYNEAGKLSRKIIYDRDWFGSSIEPSDIPRYIEYTYNENGHLIQMKEGFDDPNQVGAYIWEKTEVYNVDENGKIIYANVTKNDGTTTYTYHYETQYVYTGNN